MSYLLPTRPGDGPLTRAQLEEMWHAAFGRPWPELPDDTTRYCPGDWERQRRQYIAALIARDPEHEREVP